MAYDGSIQTLSLKLELGEMRAHVQAMIADHNREIESAIERQLAEMGQEFDFAAEVRRTLRPLIEAEVRRMVTAVAKEQAGEKVRVAVSAILEEPPTDAG